MLQRRRDAPQMRLLRADSGTWKKRTPYIPSPPWSLGFYNHTLGVVKDIQRILQLVPFKNTISLKNESIQIEIPKTSISPLEPEQGFNRVPKIRCRLCHCRAEGGGTILPLPKTSNFESRNFQTRRVFQRHLAEYSD